MSQRPDRPGHASVDPWDQSMTPGRRASTLRWLWPLAVGLVTVALAATLWLRLPETAPLHRLGGEVWDKAKRKAAKQVRDTAAELLHIYAQRAARQGQQSAQPADHADAGDLTRGHELEAMPGRRHESGLEPALGTHEGDPDLGVLTHDRVGQRERGHHVSTGAAAGQHDAADHVPPPRPRRVGLEAHSSMPTAVRLMASEVPP